MYNEQDLVDRIKDKTGYSNVELTQSLMLESLISQTEILKQKRPRIYVGHKTIRLRYPEQTITNGYREVENPLILVTGVRFLTARLDFAETFLNIYNSLNLYSPITTNTGIEDENASILMYLSGEAIFAGDDFIWWEDLWGYEFPRLIE